VAGFVAYGHAVQSHPKDPQPFGQGNIKGLIAPEAAVDAKDGGSLLPTLALGLPGSEACVILLAVFAMHGLVPGTPMLTTHLTLTYTLILALLFSNVLTSLVGIWIAPALSQLRSFRIDRIALPALLICVVSAVQLEGRITDLYVSANDYISSSINITRYYKISGDVGIGYDVNCTGTVGIDFYATVADSGRYDVALQL
jgi:putative tricarboxylic transport membrane protein